MFIVNLFGRQLTTVGRDFLVNYQPGGVVLLGENVGTPQETTYLINQYQETITGVGGVPLFVAVDQEAGPIARLKDGFTAFPTPALITASGDPQLAYQVGQATAQELMAVGVNMDLAPVADLETNPKNPIILRRSFGSNPTSVSPMIGAFVDGMQQAGVMATAKHFPGHGESSVDSHMSLPVINLSRERLETVELAPFRAAIDSQVAAVMVAHIWYPALEPQENLPASLSSQLVTGLLREEMGYDGLIMTDALDMDAIDTTYSYSDAVIKAIQAGVDLVIIAHISLDSQIQAIKAVVDAVKTGLISEERINQSVQRILDAKTRYHILDWQPLDAQTASQRIDLDNHAELVNELFQRGVTLVYDRAHFVPLNLNQHITLVYPANRPQIAQECGTDLSGIHWVSVSDSPSNEEIKWAKDAAQQSNMMVVFTQNAVFDVQQEALVNALPPEKTLVVALWSVYDWTVFPNIAGYIVTYSPATPAIPAVCSILLGRVSASGRLAITLSPDWPAF